MQFHHAKQNVKQKQEAQRNATPLGEKIENRDEHKYKQISTSICDPLVSGSPYPLCKQKVTGKINK